MRQVFCPRLIGRADELRVITDALDSASGKNPHGQAVFLVGEAGVGKSRLTREAEELARERQLRTLRGRSVEGGQGGAGAFRPLAEALLSALRQEPLSASIPELRPFQPILARLIPDWRERGATPIEESLVLLGEAVLRLLKVLGSVAGYRGCLLVLEDLHWADSETMAVIEYLAANVSSEPLVIVATTRPELSSDALRLAHLMSAQRLSTLMELERLSSGDVAAMASACLDGAPVPQAIERLLEATAEGLPLLVEDLLAAWSDGGALVCEAGTWQVERSFAAVVPMSFAETVRGRLRRLGADARRILQLAALLGRHFEWTLLPAASGLDSERVLAALHGAVDAQLVIALPTGFAFRHALTRDAVLQDLLPVERARDAARLLKLIEGAHPDLAGEWRELAASLAEAAGDRLHAARLLLQGGRDLLESGALVSAEQTLEHARALAGPASDVRVDAGRALLEVLAQSGKYERATEIGSEVLRELRTHTPARGSESLAEVHLTMAAAAVAASHMADANHHLAAARELDLNAELEARIAALAAHVAIDQRRVADAARLAEAALDAAERGNQIDVGCEALIVLGRLARGQDLDRAADAFERARALAHAHGQTIWETRALHELGTIDMFRNAAPDRLLEARALALDSGALATAAWVDGELAALFNTRFDMTRSLEYASSALAAARRYHLVGVEAMSLAFVAEVHAYRQDRAAVERTRVEMQALEFDDPFIEEVAWECRAITSLLAENRQRAARELEEGVAILRTNAASAPTPLLALWVLLELVERGEAGDHRDELRHSSSMVNLTNRGYLAYADAVASARQGDVAAAEAHVLDGDQTLRVAPWYFQYGRRLIAEAAIRDGWGQPVAWLRGAEAFFAEHQYAAMASACRSLLRKAGVGGVRPRVHRGVPPAFRDSGVTEREVEVLTVLATGLSNREIGARLYVSPKTVEKHVASLMDKLNVRTRTQLATLAAKQLGVDVTTPWGKTGM